jgi:hypothetical protein
VERCARREQRDGVNVWRQASVSPLFRILSRRFFFADFFFCDYTFADCGFYDGVPRALNPQTRRGTAAAFEFTVPTRQSQAAAL